MKCFTLLGLLFLSVSNLNAELKCSANGTQIIFVNGIMTSETDAKVSASLIYTIAENNKKSIDSYGDIMPTVETVHNVSNTFISDIEELRNQAAQNFSEQERKEFYDEMLKTEVFNDRFHFEPNKEKLKKLTSDALEIIHSENNSSLLTEQEQKLKEESLGRIKNSIRQINERAWEIIRNAEADLIVTKKVKDKLISSIKDNKKVIFVAHSQGNEVLLTAANELNANPTEFGNQANFAKFQKVFGSLHIATPANKRATPSRSEYVTLNKDLVIWGADMFIMNSNYPPETPNYEVVNFKKEGFWAKFLDFIPIVNVIADEVQSSQFHGMVASYLNPNITARRIGFTQEKSMPDIFSENMIKVAETLEDNCQAPNIVIESPDGIFENASSLVTSGYAGLNRMINLKASDTNDVGEEKTTQFEWKYTKLIPVKYFSLDGQIFFEGVISKPSSSFDQNSQKLINLPFNNHAMSVEITATNKAGKKSFKSVNLVNRNNRAPTASIESQQCLIGNDGYTYLDNEYVYRIDDDSKFTRGLVKGKFMHLIYNTPPLEISITDSFGLRSPLSISNVCPNRFQVGEVQSFCEGDRSAISVRITSVKGASVYFIDSINSGSVSIATSSRNSLPGNSYESVYTYPWRIKEGDYTPKFNIKVNDYWSGEMVDAGEATMLPCQPN